MCSMNEVLFQLTSVNMSETPLPGFYHQDKYYFSDSLPSIEAALHGSIKQDLRPEMLPRFTLERNSARHVR